MKYYYCVDIGGTGIKCGIIDEKNKLLYTNKIKTAIILASSDFATGLWNFLCDCEKESNYQISLAAGLGIGITGIIDSNAGIIKFSRSLHLNNYNIVKKLQKYTNIKIKIANDAELATLSELHFGLGKQFKNFVLLTLGTGVGCGVVVNGKSLRTFCPFACEVGHNKFLDDEFEKYASTKALESQLSIALKNNRQSKMWQTTTPETVNGKTIFEYLAKDKTAKETFDKFISYVGDGISNIVNLVCPEAVIIGGSISSEKETLTKPLQNYVNEHIFARNCGFKVKVLSAKMTRHSGIFGAKALFEKEDL